MEEKKKRERKSDKEGKGEREIIEKGTDTLCKDKIYVHYT